MVLADFDFCNKIYSDLHCLQPLSSRKTLEAKRCPLLNYGLIKRTTMCYLKVVWRLNNPICVRQDSIFYTVCRDLFNYVLWSGLQDSSVLLYLTLQANIGQEIYSLWDRDGGCWVLEIWLSYKFWLFGEVRCSLWCSPPYQTERKMVLILTCSWNFMGSFLLHAQWPELKFSAHTQKGSNGKQYGLWTIVVHLRDLLLYKHVSRHLSPGHLILSSAIIPRNFKLLRWHVHLGWTWSFPYRNPCYNFMIIFIMLFLCLCNLQSFIKGCSKPE